MFWYEEEVRQLEKKLTIEKSASGRLVFYGSSSIRLWTTLSVDFPDKQPLNLGFGGSTLAACTWYFERLVVPIKPAALIFYAGDNDLGDNRHPEEVFLFFCALADKVDQYLPGVPFTYLAIKPSPARWPIVDRIRFTNKIIANKVKHLPNCQFVDLFTPMLNSFGHPRPELFESDGLHLNAKGYAVWKEVLSNHI